MAGSIFISYRRDDTKHAAARLRNLLKDNLPQYKVFMDIHDLQPGRPFPVQLRAALTKCDVFLALIGPNWLGTPDQGGKHRLYNTDDFVRQEIIAALSSDMLVIPILLDGANMPPPDILPESIQPIIEKQAVKLTHDNFEAEVVSLFRSINSSLKQPSSLGVIAVTAIVYLILLAGAYIVIKPTLHYSTLDPKHFLSLQQPIGFKIGETSTLGGELYIDRSGGLVKNCDLPSPSSIMIRAREGGVRVDTKTESREPLKWLIANCRPSEQGQRALFNRCFGYKMEGEEPPEGYYPRIDQAQATRIGLRMKGTHQFRSDIGKLDCQIFIDSDEGPVKAPSLEEQEQLIASEATLVFGLVAFVLLLITSMGTFLAFKLK